MLQAFSSSEDDKFLSAKNLIKDSKIQPLKIRKKDEAFISAENEKEFEDLRSKINTKLFNGIYTGWISMENHLGNLRSSLFDMGCIKDERTANCGKMFANIRIGNDELDQFLTIKGFELCHDEDILLA